MPKLNAATAKKVASAESTIGVVDEGVYIAKLKAVEVKSGPAGPYWSWVFILKGGKGQQWVNTSLAENAQWKMKEVFEAFGVPTDTDTDLLLGKMVKLVVSQRTIEKGSRMGEMGNTVDKVMPLSSESDEPEEAETGDDDEPEVAPVAAAKSTKNGKSAAKAKADDDEDF